MDALFPFGFPGATVLYLSLYVVTLVAHGILVQYVLAGSAYVAVRRVIDWRRGERTCDPVAKGIADWLPFGLGAAITAGVAPLLFLQILYKESFYTANLLLFHRWMAVVPVLLAGFYLLYLGKTERFAAWSGLRRSAVSVAAFLCFAFVAFSWTENHLLAIDQGAWVEQYGSERLFYTTGALAPRFGFWLVIGAPVMAAIAGWQLWAAQPSDESMAAASRRLAIIALAGLAIAAGPVLLLWRQLGPAGAEVVGSSAVLPYLVLACVGGLAQVAAWIAVSRARRATPTWLAVASAGVFLMVLGGAVVREGIRLASLGEPGLFALHERASEAAGMPVFFVFLAINGGIVVWIARMTRRGLRATDR